MDDALKPLTDGALESELELYREELAQQNEELDRANAARTAAQAQLAVLFDAAPTGHAALDKSGAIVAINRALGALAGQPTDLLLGKPFDALLVAGDRPRFRTYRERLLAGEGSTSCEVALDLASNVLVVRVEAALLPSDLPDAPEMILSVTDETERRRLDLERRVVDKQINEIARLDSLARMAGGVAHDFNNLLTIMLLELDFAAGALSAESAAGRSIAQAQRAAQQATLLALQMLAYAGGSVIEKQPIELAKMVREMEPLLRAMTKNVAVRVELAGGLPPVDGDALQLQQVVLNLVLNAAEAIGERHGTITVSVKGGGGGADTSNRRSVELTVRDDGPGMNEDTQRRAFDPFFSTKFTGRGLGLAVVYGNVKGHQGTVTIQSEVGAGTVFKVALPALATAVTAAPSPRTLERWRGQGCVLVVDDEPQIRSVLQRQLGRLGLTVVEAAGGTEALEMLRNSPTSIAAVLLDVTMPGMDGPAMLRELRARGDERPVVLMSGYASSRIDEATLALSQAFLPKPLTMRDVESAMRALPVLTPDA